MLNPENFLACGGPSYHPSLLLYHCILRSWRRSAFRIPFLRSVYQQKRRFPTRSCSCGLRMVDACYYRRGNFKVRVDAASKTFCEWQTHVTTVGKTSKTYWNGFYTVLRIVDARSYARKTTTNHIRAVYTPLDVNHVSEIIAKQSSFAYNALGVVRVT